MFALSADNSTCVHRTLQWRWLGTQKFSNTSVIDLQKKETARASMRKMVKHLLKKYKYPPEDYDTAISTVIILQTALLLRNMSSFPTAIHWRKCCCFWKINHQNCRRATGKSDAVIVRCGIPPLQTMTQKSCSIAGYWNFSRERN